MTGAFARRKMEWALVEGQLVALGIPIYSAGNGGRWRTFPAFGKRVSNRVGLVRPMPATRPILLPEQQVQSCLVGIHIESALGRNSGNRDGPGRLGLAGLDIAPDLGDGDRQPTVT